MIDTARRILGIVLVVGIPPAIAFWLVVHPFAKLWRRLDVRLTYALLALFGAGLAVSAFVWRGPLVGRDLGTSPFLIGAGVILYGMAIVVSVLCKRQLDARTFAGVPEVSGGAYPGRLLQEGIYGVVRHPRYLSVILGTTGWAMVANHLGAYVVLAACLLGLWPTIVLEERELADRFGAAYAAYRRRVPALIPRPGGSRRR